MQNYSKPHLTLEEQLDLLKSRGMEITDDGTAVNYLHRIGYYRLSGYWYPFRKYSTNRDKSKIEKRKDDFMEGTKFQEIVELYIFDKKLRLLILDALERIEIAIRVDIANTLGEKDRFAHNNTKFLHGNFTKKFINKNGKTGYETWRKKYETAMQRSKEDFIKHYKSKYGKPFPIWVAIEIWNFGMLSNFFKGMKVEDKNKIANKYGIQTHTVMESWLRSLNYIRNLVAHHSRLWNRNIIDQPKLPRDNQVNSFQYLIDKPKIISRICIVFFILTYLIKKISPNSSWPKRLIELIQDFPKARPVGIKDMGLSDEILELLIKLSL